MKVFATGQSTDKVFADVRGPVKVFASGGIGTVSAMDATPSVGLRTTPDASGYVSNLMPIVNSCRNSPEGNVICP